MLTRRLTQQIVGTAWLALLGTTAAAQPARPPVQPVPPGQLPGAAVIAGIIKSSTDDVPIARARVIATADVLPEPRVVISGPDGRYALADLPVGSYTVSVTRTGFVPQTYATGRAITPSPIAVTAGQRTISIDFALVPAGFIAGRIMDEDGTPFAGAIVDALITRSENGSDRLFSVATSQTDDRGEFRLIGLAPGQYYVSAADPAFRAVSTPKGVLHYSPAYYPGTPYADRARAVVLTGTGEPPRVEFRLSLVPPARVAGHLVAFDGKQLFSAAIIMSPRPSSSTRAWRRNSLHWRYGRTACARRWSPCHGSRTSSSTNRWPMSDCWACVEYAWRARAMRRSGSMRWRRCGRSRPSWSSSCRCARRAFACSNGRSSRRSARGAARTACRCISMARGCGKALHTTGAH